MKNKSKVAGEKKNDPTITFKLLKPLNAGALTIEKFANTEKTKKLQ